MSRGCTSAAEEESRKRTSTIELPLTPGLLNKSRKKPLIMGLTGLGLGSPLIGWWEGRGYFVIASSPDAGHGVVLSNFARICSMGPLWFPGSRAKTQLWPRCYV